MTNDKGYTLLKVASDTDCSRTFIMEVPNKIKETYSYIRHSLTLEKSSWTLKLIVFPVLSHIMK